MLGARIFKVVYHLGYRLDERGIGNQFPVWARTFLHNIQTISKAYPSPYAEGTLGCFPGVK
jgi:hypothetical protein